MALCLIEYFSVRGNGYDLPRNKLSAALQCDFCRVFQSAAAGHFHAHDGHAFNIVIANYFGELLGIVHAIQFRAADIRNISFYEAFVECVIGIRRAVGSAEQLSAFKVRRVHGNKLYLHGLL